VSAGERAGELADPVPAVAGDVERTVAVWRAGMSRAAYERLLRLLFDPEPGRRDDDTAGGQAA
jgi:hypothetical protein